MNKNFVLIVVSYLLTHTQNIVSASTSTCPCNITQFENDFFKETSSDFRVADKMARKHVVVALLDQIDVILKSCPDFCFASYFKRAAPLIDAGTLEVSDHTAKLNTKLAVSVVKKSSCKYNYASLIADSLPDIKINMKNCARKVGASAVTNAIIALKKECPNLDTAVADSIKIEMAAILETTLSPLAKIAAAVTAKNLLAALPCGSWEIVPGIEIPSLV